MSSIGVHSRRLGRPIRATLRLCTASLPLPSTPLTHSYPYPLVLCTEQQQAWRVVSVWRHRLSSPLPPGYEMSSERVMRRQAGVKEPGWGERGVPYMGQRSPLISPFLLSSQRHCCLSPSLLLLLLRLRQSRMAHNAKHNNTD